MGLLGFNMPKWMWYGIAGSVLWLIATWVFGDFGLGLTGWWFDLLFIVSIMEMFPITETIMAVLRTKTIMAVLGGWIVVWIVVWVVCWAFVKGKDK